MLNCKEKCDVFVVVDILCPSTGSSGPVVNTFSKEELSGVEIVVK